MGSTGKTVGTVGGAAIGTAIMPGVGTIIGGGLGGLVGGLFDSSGGSTPQVTDVGYGGVLGDANHSDLKFGQSEADRVRDRGFKAADNMAARGQAVEGQMDQRGLLAQHREQVLGSQAQAQARAGQLAAGAQQGRSNQYQSDAIGAANQYGGMSADERAQQQSALARLQGFYQQGPGPSAAEAQMQQGADVNAGQAIALARSGRGVGANGASMRQAMFGNAAAGQQMNQQLGVLRANEAANWRQQQLGAMGMEQNTLAGMRGQDINAQGQAYGFGAQMGGQGLGYGQLGQGYQQIGNQAQLGFEGQGNQTMVGMSGIGANAGLGYTQLANQSAQFGEQLRNKIFNDTTNANMAGQTANANLAAGHAAGEQRQDAANTAQLGSILAGAGQMIGNRGSGGGGGTVDEQHPWG